MGACEKRGLGSGLPYYVASTTAVSPSGDTRAGTYEESISKFDGENWVNHTRADGSDSGWVDALAVGQDSAIRGATHSG